MVAIFRTNSIGRWIRRALMFSLMATTSVCGQVVGGRSEPDSFVNQQRRLDERLRQQFDAELGDTRDVLFDWGGWYSFHFFAFDDGVNSSRTLRRNDLRMWARLTLDEGTHEFYVRPRLSFIDFNSGDAYDGNDDELEGPKFERAYYRTNLTRMFRLDGDGAVDLKLQVGRDLVQFGTGLTLAMTLDHAQVAATWGDLRMTAFGGRTVGSMPDFDLSRSADRTRRDLFGAEIRYLGFERHEPFVYAIYQKDRNREGTYRRFQEFDYDSYYVGAGSVGELANHWHYEAEAVFEGGSSWGDGQFLKSNDIRAYSASAMVEYLHPGPKRGRLSLAYLFGSGDAGRLLSPTNSLGGNMGDFVDTSFIGFGYRDAGIAFAPTYANLHMGRLGGSIYPVPDHKLFGQLETGADVYVFHKHQSAGAVSDPTAGLQRGYLGCEVDWFANWRITVDLSCTARYGAFFPGDAFSDRSVRSFFWMGMTWSF